MKCWFRHLKFPLTEDCVESSTIPKLTRPVQKCSKNEGLRRAPRSGLWSCWDDIQEGKLMLRGCTVLRSQRSIVLATERRAIADKFQMLQVDAHCIKVETDTIEPKLLVIAVCREE